MPARNEYPRPGQWAEYKKTVRHPWAMPAHGADWCLRWLAYHLSRWALLEVLQSLGTFSVLIAVIFYFTEAGDRKKQKHYQAWQVINTAQGKGGSGGRIEALQELNLDREPLVGVDASEAFLQGIRLPKANLLRCDLHAADLRDSVFSGSNMEFASLHSANFRQADLRNTNLAGADLGDSDLNAANLSGSNLDGVDLSSSDLRYTDLSRIRWQKIRSIEAANIYGIRNPPPGFVEWAMRNRAISQRDGE
jgi:hypothetical protein